MSNQQRGCAIYHNGVAKCHCGLLMSGLETNPETGARTYTHFTSVKAQCTCGVASMTVYVDYHKQLAIDFTYDAPQLTAVSA